MDKPVKEDKIQLNLAKMSIILALALLVIKYYAYYITGSGAILSDALESIVNVIAGVFLLGSLKFSLNPVDEDHPYGHGKIEYISSIFEGGAIAFAGLFILIDSIRYILDPRPIEELGLGLILVMASGLINGGVGLLIKRKGIELNSMAMISNGAHLISDFITTIGIVVALLLVKFTGIYYFDSICATIVGILLIKSGFGILKESSNHLLDGLDEDVIEELIESFEKSYRPGLIQIHDLKTIRSGKFHHIDAHLTVPGHWSVELSHEFGELIERDLFKIYGKGGEFNFHLDPCFQKFCDQCELKNCPVRTTEFIKRLPFNLKEVIS